MTLLYDDAGRRETGVPELDQAAIDVFLDPGEYFVGDAAFQVRTLLGSCVSIVLWHARLRHGAMSHFILPTRRRAGREPVDPQPQPRGKYADEVLDLMLAELRQAKVPVHECVGKVFGGGDMFPGRAMSDKLNVGKRNGEAALQLLRERGVPIVAQDLYGVGHRQLIFNLRTGDVWVRQDRAGAETD